MLARNLKIILIIVLASVAIFSIVKYLAALKERYGLLTNLNRTKRQIAVLEEMARKEQELQMALSQENAALKDELKANIDRLNLLDTDLRNSEKTIDELTAQLAISKVENTALREEKDKLSQELARASRENDALKARLSSVPELKKAIREVKEQIRKAKLTIREVTERRRTIEGNRGFLLRNGKPAFPVTKIKIEVMPASQSK